MPRMLTRPKVSRRERSFESATEKRQRNEHSLFSKPWGADLGIPQPPIGSAKEGGQGLVDTWRPAGEEMHVNLGLAGRWQNLISAYLTFRDLPFNAYNTRVLHFPQCFVALLYLIRL
jgi:hypothetical protein